MTGRHRPPSRLTVARVAVADGVVLALGLTCGIANAAAPHAHAPVTVAAPTAVDLREPTGHGGPIGPLTGPSFAPDVPVWTEEKGPVIVNGQALARPTVAAPENLNDAAPVQVSAAEPEPEPAPPVAPAAAEPTPTPVVVAPEPTEPEVTEPEVTELDVTTPVETTPPTEPPAEPTVPVELTPPVVEP